MYYRITDHVALRSWSDTGFAIYRRGTRRPLPLSERLAAAMLLADGEHDMDTDDTVVLLVMNGLIEPCEKGERPSAWSAFRAYDNACFPMMNLMITGKCKDITKCRFFEDGWHQKTVQALPGWTNLSEIGA